MKYLLEKRKDHLFLTLEGDANIKILIEALKEAKEALVDYTHPSLILDGYALDTKFKMFEKHHVIS